MQRGFLLGSPKRPPSQDKREGVASPKLTEVTSKQRAKYGDKAHAHAETLVVKLPANPDEVTIERGFVEDFPHERVLQFFEGIARDGNIQQLCDGTIPYDQVIAPTEVTEAVTRPVTVTVLPGHDVPKGTKDEEKAVDFVAARKAAIGDAFGSVLLYDCLESDIALARSNKQITKIYYCCLRDDGSSYPAGNARMYDAHECTAPDKDGLKFSCIVLGYYLSRFSESNALLTSLITYFDALLLPGGRLSFTLPHGDLNSPSSPLNTLAYRMDRGYYPTVLNRTWDGQVYCDYDIPLSDIDGIVRFLPGNKILEVVPFKSVKQDLKTHHKIKEKGAATLCIVLQADTRRPTGGIVVDSTPLPVPTSSSAGVYPSTDNNNNNNNSSYSYVAPLSAHIPAVESIVDDPSKCYPTTEIARTGSNTKPTMQTILVTNTKVLSRLNEELVATRADFCYPRSCTYVDFSNMCLSRLYFCKRQGGVRGVVFPSKVLGSMVVAIDGGLFRTINMPLISYCVTLAIFNDHYSLTRKVTDLDCIAIDCNYPSGLLGRINYLRTLHLYQNVSWLPLHELPDLLDSIEEETDFTGIYVCDASSPLRTYDPIVNASIYPAYYIPPTADYIRIEPSSKVDWTLACNELNRERILEAKIVFTLGDGSVMPAHVNLDGSGKFAAAHEIQANTNVEAKCTLDSLLLLATTMRDSYRWEHETMVFDIDSLFPDAKEVNEISCEIGRMEKLAATYPHRLKWDKATSEQRIALYVLRHARYQTMPGANLIVASFLEVARDVMNYTTTVGRAPKRKRLKIFLPVEAQEEGFE